MTLELSFLGLFLAFGGGMVSFLSPCVLPLVPGYLSTISGVSFADIQEGRDRSKVLGPAILFCLSFTVMFVALGMTATGVGSALQDHRRLLQQIAGVVLIVLGVFVSEREFHHCYQQFPIRSPWIHSPPLNITRNVSRRGSVHGDLDRPAFFVPCRGA